MDCIHRICCQCVLDYGLIFGHFGLPELGFVGAAYASVAAEMIGLLGMDHFEPIYW